MLFSMGLIFIIGLVLGEVFSKLKLPKLLGFLIAGLILGPYGLNWIDGKVLNISSDLRKFALIIILLRAGFNLDFNALRKVGRPAFLLSFVPATFEILGMIFLAPLLLGVSRLDAAIMGTVVAAVSPAVVVPRMLNLIENKYGERKGIPQMLMAAASVDDIFVIILFTSLTNLAQTSSFSLINFLTVPTSIILGIVGGIVMGNIMSILFKKIRMSNIHRMIFLLSLSFVLVRVEDLMSGLVGFSSLLAIMALSATIKQKREEESIQLSISFSNVWVGAEVLLFVLVGASVNISYALNAGFITVVLILGVVLFRVFGVLLSLVKTNLNMKERLFSVFSFLPKATVQAAIGGLPLAMGLSSGELILTLAVVSILVTAPLGAILMDKMDERLLVE